MNSVLRPAIEKELQQQNDELRATLLQDAVIQVPFPRTTIFKTTIPVSYLLLNIRFTSCFQIKNRILSVEQQSVDQMTGIVLEREGMASDLLNPSNSSLFRSRTIDVLFCLILIIVMK